MTAAILRPVYLSDDGQILHLLDQRRLPQEETWLQLCDIESVAQAIESLAVRGAPAIACAAALGFAAATHTFPREPERFIQACHIGLERLAKTRPTAVNLFVALQQISSALPVHISDKTVQHLIETVHGIAVRHVEADLAACLTMSRYGETLLPANATVLTHCNTGALATAGWGTALGVIRQAHALGRGIRVLVDETRPVLQGARLTAWELVRDGIPAEVITDSMAGMLMAQGEVDVVIVGADRIARNGDVANKIGTYSLAVLCHYHHIPFYVAAPWTTIDLNLRNGQEIPIEERNLEEIHFHGGQRMTPPGVGARNPAFDITPAELVTSIITDRGIFTPHEIAAQPNSLR